MQSADIQKLIAEERLLEAASLLATRSMHAEAGVLYERACAYREAATQAMLAGEHVRAVCLAHRTEDATLQAHAEASMDTIAEAREAGEQLQRQGLHRASARMFALSGDALRAADDFERAGLWLQAAEQFEKGGNVREAARVLGAAAKSELTPAPFALALGKLLVTHARYEHAARALQSIAKDAPEYEAARPWLERALRALGVLPGTSKADEPDMSSRRDVQEPQERWFGRYRVVRVVARSPHAEVVYAEDLILARHVAIKRFTANAGTNRDAWVRFEREARVLASLQHPNVVPLLEYLSEGPALVMPWMAGGNLEQRLALSPKRIVEIGCAMLRALETAHSVGIVHRDIKPANILFDEGDTPRLADFGAAHVGESSQTATAGFIGTFRYMSPEQKRGEPATAASDIYGLGSVLLELLTGHVTLHEQTDHRLGQMQQDALAAFLAERPSDRPSAREAMQRLGAVAWLDEVVERERLPSQRPLPALQSARTIDRITLTPEGLTRARAFAQCTHPWAQSVLGLEGTTLRLAALVGAPRVDVDVSELLSELRLLGYEHGKIQADDVWEDTTRGVQLRFREYPRQ